MLVHGMGFMYLSPQGLKTFTVLKKDIQSLIWDLLVTTSDFMWAAIGAPGSTYDSRSLKSCEIY